MVMYRDSRSQEKQDRWMLLKINSQEHLCKVKIDRKVGRKIQMAVLTDWMNG